jgi:hypothetical protein
MAKYFKLLIIILIGGSLVQLDAKPRKSFLGNAVAIADFILCLNGNAYGGLLIQLAAEKQKGPEFMVISASIPCERFDEWLKSLSSHNQYSVFHGNATVTIIQEYADDDATPERNDGIEIFRYSIWKHLPGKESFQIPYGTSILTYESADWPVVPVI